MFTTLRAKVFAGFLLILLLLVGLGGYAIFTFASLTDVTSTGLQQSAEQSLANSDMYESLVRIDQAELRMLAGDSANSVSVLQEQPAHFYYALQNAQKNHVTSNDSVAMLLDDLDHRWQDYESHLTNFENLALHRPTRARRFYEDTLAHEVEALKGLNLALQNKNYEAFQNTKTEAKDRAKQSTLGVIFVTLFAVVIGLIGSYWIARRTIKPLKDLTDSVKQLQGGQLDLRIPISGADEISDLGYEFNRLTERLQQFEAMNINEIVREQEKSEAIIESIDDPLILFDAAGTVLLMNKASEEITGITEQTALGRPLWQLFRDKNVLKDVERALEQAAQLARTEPIEDGLQNAPHIVSIERRGRMRYFRMRVARIVTSRGAQSGTTAQPVIGILVLFTDITHFKEIDKMKSDFIAKVSHEFRTPLTSMTMSLDILGDELLGKLNLEQLDIIDTSKQDARRLSKLIRDLLTLSRLESTKPRSEQADEVFDIGSVLEQLIRSLRPLYTERRVELKIENNISGTARMSQEHFVSIVSNLLSNALKHTPSGGSVTVETERSDSRGELTLRVSDTGIGIAPADQKRIFEKFVQLKHTDTATPGSVGLGLAIVREIAARYDGSVTLESTPGKGSTFTVKLRVEMLDVKYAQESVRSHE